ncbi:hypothetical protein DFP72DRAFT_1066440 [Ephemerocybe angulata]|uniref:Uncharacterized protein n=1 Tax=Ephemerocybe angulata TaxID=980116 RepID=A0A8H6I369_9AGAR|nr:hypothetical protein DFP72DRAFT_1066440 [Tulosesus angulatus]
MENVSSWRPKPADMDLSSLPPDLYGICPTSTTQQINLEKSPYKGDIKKIPWRPKDTLPTLINTVLNSALVYPALLKYDKVFTLRPNKGESASGFTHRAILRDAFLSCLAEACDTNSILISPRLQSLLISPQFVSGNSKSNIRDAAAKTLNQIDQLCAPFIAAIQPLLLSNAKESLKEMSAALHGCIAYRFSAVSLSQCQAKYKHNGHPIKFWDIILDMVTPLDNNTQKNQIPDLSRLRLRPLLVVESH